MQEYFSIVVELKTLFYHKKIKGTECITDVVACMVNYSNVSFPKFFARFRALAFYYIFPSLAYLSIEICSAPG